MSSFDYLEAASIEEAIALLGQHGDAAHLIAGGTSVVLLLRQGLLQPRVLVGIRKIPELCGVKVGDDGSLVIGAAETIRALERAPAVRAYSPALTQALGEVATVRVRNQATIGGNLAHADPAQDPPPILIALDASAHVSGPFGERQVPLGALFVDFFETSLQPGEVITSVFLPPRSREADAVYIKFLPGSKDDYATVSVAVSGRRVDGLWCDVRIACGAAGPRPIRVRAAEDAVANTHLDAGDLDRAASIVAQAVDPIDDLRGSADYKREMAAVWTRRALERLAGRAPRDGREVR